MSLEGLRVGVVFGSRSVEHEISVITACQAMPVLEELGAEVTPIYITKDGCWITGAGLTDLDRFRGSLPRAGDPVLLDLAAGAIRIGGGALGRSRAAQIDVLFPILHGTFGEDGSLAGLAALARIPQVGSDVLSSALAMDKLRSRQLFSALGLPGLPAGGCRSVEEALAFAQALGYPVVVKPNRGGSSIGVGIARGRPELREAAAIALAYDVELVVEPALSGASDLNCAVKRGEPRFSEVERALRSGELLSYSDKYASRAKVPLPPGQLPSGGAKGAYPDFRHELPAQIPEELRSEVRRISVAAFDALGCSGTARVDFLLSERGELYLNEVNTIPGSLAFHLWQASGVDYPSLLEELVREALEAGERRTLAMTENLLSTEQILGKGARA